MICPETWGPQMSALLLAQTFWFWDITVYLTMIDYFVYLYWSIEYWKLETDINPWKSIQPQQLLETSKELNIGGKTDWRVSLTLLLLTSWWYLVFVTWPFFRWFHFDKSGLTNALKGPTFCNFSAFSCELVAEWMSDFDLWILKSPSSQSCQCLRNF